MEAKPCRIQGRLLETSELLRVFVTKLCDKIMRHGRSYLLDQFTLRQSSFNTAFFPQGFPYSVMAVPLDLPHKRVGVIALVRDEKNALYREQDLQLLGVGHGDATHRQQRHECAGDARRPNAPGGPGVRGSHPSSCFDHLS